MNLNSEKRIKESCYFLLLLLVIAMVTNVCFSCSNEKQTIPTLGIETSAILG